MSTCWPSQSLSEASPSTFHLHFIYQSVSPCPHISSISKEAWDVKIFSVSACCRSQKNCCSQFSSVSRSVVSDSLRFHGLQNARLPCPSPIPKTCSNWCPLNRWCHPTISSSVIPFSFCFQSFLALGSFPMNHFFTSGGQSIGASISASMTIQDWFPSGLTGLISLLSKRLPRVFFNTTVQKHQFFSAQLSSWFNSHIHTWLLEKL